MARSICVKLIFRASLIFPPRFHNMKLSLILITLLVLTPSLFLGQIFTAVTEGDIVGNGGNSFGHTIADFNNDGWDDVFIQNLASGEPNLFYKNNGAGTFTKITDIAIATGNASTSVTWGDFNGDGYNDVYVANGGTVASNKKNFLYVNNDDETFTEIEDGQLTTLIGRYEGVTCSEYDGDGDVDLFLSNYFGNDNLLYNNPGNANHWLGIRLTGITTNTNAIGSKVNAYATIDGTAVCQYREVICQSGHVTQGSFKQHFGLGRCCRS
jgi:hypothetical protein